MRSAMDERIKEQNLRTYSMAPGSHDAVPSNFECIVEASIGFLGVAIIMYWTYAFFIA